MSFLERSTNSKPDETTLFGFVVLLLGISVALALSIPATLSGEPVAEREVVVSLTYIVVVFSIVVQGLTIGPLLRRWEIVSPNS